MPKGIYIRQPFSETHRLNLSKAKSGKNHPMFGKKHTFFTKEKMSKSQIKHGYRNTSFYKSWQNMKSRCDNLNNSDYKNYGGRGISYSYSWKEFVNFQKDMESTYRKGLTLDRINNNKGYSKENCRWATYKEQNNNRRDNHLFSYNGISDTLTGWAKRLKINKSTLSERFYIYKWSIEKVLTTEVRHFG